METALVPYILQSLDEISSDNATNKGVDFDQLVRTVEGKMGDPDVQTLRRFGARVDSLIASILAPLIETGEVIWEPKARTVTVSAFALLLLRSAVSGKEAYWEPSVQRAAAR